MMEEKIYTNIPVREVTVREEDVTGIGFVSDVEKEQDFNKANMKISVEDYKTRANKFIAFDDNGQATLATFALDHGDGDVNWVDIKKLKKQQSNLFNSMPNITNGIGGIVGESDSESNPVEMNNIFSKIKKISGEGDSAVYEIFLSELEAFKKADGTILYHGAHQVTGKDIRVGGIWKSIKKFFVQLGGWLWKNGGKQLYTNAVKVALDKTKEVSELGQDFLKNLLPTNVTKDVNPAGLYNTYFNASAQNLYHNEDKTKLYAGIIVSYAQVTNDGSSDAFAMTYNQLGYIRPANNDNGMEAVQLVKASGVENELIQYIKLIKPYILGDGTIGYVLIGLANGKIQAQFVTVDGANGQITRIDEAVDVAFSAVDNPYDFENPRCYLDLGLYQPAGSVTKDYLIVSSGSESTEYDQSTVVSLEINKLTGDIKQHSEQYLDIINSQESINNIKVFTYLYNFDNYVLTCGVYDNISPDDKGINIPAKTVLELRKLVKDEGATGIMEAGDVLSRVVIEDPLLFYNLDVKPTSSGAIAILVGGVKFDNTTSQNVYAYTLQDKIIPLAKQNLGHGVFGSTNSLYYDDEAQVYKYLSVGGTSSYISSPIANEDVGSNIELAFSNDYSFVNNVITSNGLELSNNSNGTSTMAIELADSLTDENLFSPASGNMVQQAANLFSGRNIACKLGVKKPTQSHAELFNSLITNDEKIEQVTITGTYQTKTKYAAFSTLNVEDNSSKIICAKINGTAINADDTAAPFSAQLSSDNLKSIQGLKLAYNEVARIGAANISSSNTAFVVAGFPTATNGIADKKLQIYKFELDANGTIKTYTSHEADISAYLPEDLTRTNSGLEAEKGKYSVQQLHATFIADDNSKDDSVYAGGDKILVAMQLDYNTVDYSNNTEGSNTTNVYLFALKYNETQQQYEVTQCDTLIDRTAIKLAVNESKYTTSVICGLKNYDAAVSANNHTIHKLASQRAMLYLANGAIYEYNGPDINWDSSNPVKTYRAPDEILGYEFDAFKDVYDNNFGFFAEAVFDARARLVFSLWNRVYTKDLYSSKAVMRYQSSNLVGLVDKNLTTGDPIIIGNGEKCFQQFNSDYMRGGYNIYAPHNNAIIAFDAVISTDGGITWDEIDDNDIRNHFRVYYAIYNKQPNVPSGHALYSYSDTAQNGLCVAIKPMRDILISQAVLYCMTMDR